MGFLKNMVLSWHGALIIGDLVGCRFLWPKGFRYFPFVPVLLLLVAMKRPASMKRPAASRKKPARRQGETSGFGGRSVGNCHLTKQKSATTYISAQTSTLIWWYSLAYWNTEKLKFWSLNTEPEVRDQLPYFSLIDQALLPNLPEFLFCWAFAMPRATALDKLLCTRCTCTGGKCFTQFEGQREAVACERLRFQQMSTHRKDTWMI